jgi:hypothetical protein
MAAFMKSKQTQEYTEKEKEERLQAALRGSRITGHKAMTDIPKKRVAKKRATKRRAKKRPAK